jgi:hypothetical protein
VVAPASTAHQLEKGINRSRNGLTGRSGGGRGSSAVGLPACGGMLSLTLEFPIGSYDFNFDDFTLF